MIIHLGYVSISKTLDITSSKTITYTEFKKNNNYNKINNIIIENLTNLEKIINYNIKNNIHFYRLTSKLIPLATHKDLNFDYITPYKKHYNQIATKIKKNNLRIDTHPDQFCVLNSTKKEIIDNSINILKYHYNILNALNIKNKIIKKLGNKKVNKNFYLTVTMFIIDVICFIIKNNTIKINLIIL